MSVSGLNSFKEEQVIDFAAICDGNVFGIFGPTGSGKSTVIDAITLALYGKVERAPGGLQGIVNKAVDSATVDFTFALGTAEGEETYRVERKYVSRDDAVTCRLARLTCLSGATAEVLADKVTHVDASVQSILGLSVDDFTRAVVLPQGKFAEFLSLRGKDRRGMLERIFGLSEYGEKLMAVVQSELRGIDARLRELDIRAQSLGDADNAAVRAAEDALSRARSEVSESLSELQSSESARESARRIVDLQETLAKVELRRAELDLDSPRIEHLARDLACLEKGLSIEQLVEDSLEAEQLLSQSLERQAQAQKAEAKAAQDLAEAELALQASAESLQAAEPTLQRRLMDAERAEHLERAMAGLDKEMRQQCETRELTAARHNDLLTQSETLDREAKVSTESLAELKRELDSLRVDPKLRGVLGRAEVALQRLLQARRQLDEAYAQRDGKNRALEARQEALRVAKAVLAEATVSHSRLEEEKQEILNEPGLPKDAQLQSVLIGFRLAAQEMDAASKNASELDRQLSVNTETLGSIEGNHEQLQKDRHSTQQKLEELTSAVAEAEISLEELRRRVMAESLARELENDAPCPVCGSLDHPNPAIGDDITLLGEAEGHLRDLRNEHSRMINQATALRERDMTTQAELARLRQEGARLQSRREEEQAVVSRAGQALPRDRGLVNRVESLIAELETAGTGLSEARQVVAGHLDAVTRLQEELAQSDERVGLLADEVEQERIRFEELKQQLGGADVTDFAAQVAGKDHRVEELSLFIRGKEKDLETTRAELSLVLRNLADAESLMRQSEHRVKELGQQQAQHRDEISALTEGVSAGVFRQQTKEELSRLRDTFAQAGEAQRKCAEDSARSKRAAAVATEALSGRREGAERLSLRLNESLASNGFADLATWKESVEKRPHLDGWRIAVETHRREILRYANEATRLYGELAGRSVSAEEWQLLVAQATVNAARYESAVENRGRSEAALEDVRRRNKALMTIQVEAKPLREKKGLLDELASLLRGNALVEFMATEHLYNIAGVATGWLRHLSRNRYALEVATDGGFLIRDDAEGGMLRPVFTLSGGETFVTSLALALALSSQIQLRGRYPLEFFFLDEGFGTLDPELLDVVMSALERVQGQNISIGLISHVPELRERVQRKITVIPAESGGRGSRLVLS